MPIYEYRCEKCGTFELSRRITDGPLRRCPTCRGRVRKLISNTSFQLKGSGWYVTDYAGKDGDGKKGKEESKSDSPATKETKDSSTKTETKSPVTAA
jgi:putative FmdB family regulatory protein